MRTHEELKAIALARPEVRAEYERLEREEMPILDAALLARKELGLTQAQIAERMGVSVPAVSRLENSFMTGKHSPTIETLQKYASALGKKVEIRFV